MKNVSARAVQTVLNRSVWPICPCQVWFYLLNGAINYWAKSIPTGWPFSRRVLAKAKQASLQVLALKQWKNKINDQCSKKQHMKRKYFSSIWLKILKHTLQAYLSVIIFCEDCSRSKNVPCLGVNVILFNLLLLH